MLVKLFIVTALALAQLERVSSVQFSITKDLKNAKALEKDKWSNIEILDEEDNVQVNFQVPLQISYSDVLVFFANDKKEILRVSLKDTVTGTLYEVPYKKVKEFKGDSYTLTKSEKYHLISGTFPKYWLPKKSNKISATVIGSDERIYNYYGIQNYAISLPDLMVLEEYKSYDMKN